MTCHARMPGIVLCLDLLAPAFLSMPVPDLLSAPLPLPCCPRPSSHSRGCLISVLGLTFSAGRRDVRVFCLVGFLSRCTGFFVRIGGALGLGLATPTDMVKVRKRSPQATWRFRIDRAKAACGRQRRGKCGPEHRYNQHVVLLHGMSPIPDSPWLRAIERTTQRGKCSPVTHV